MISTFHGGTIPSPTLRHVRGIGPTQASFPRPQGWFRDKISWGLLLTIVPFSGELESGRMHLISWIVHSPHIYPYSMP